MIVLTSLLLIAAPEGGDDRSRRARSIEPIARWFSDADYPADALRRGAQGSTSFRLRIDETGRLRACMIVRSAGDPALDEAACAIVFARGRFEPARDRAGRAVGDTLDSRVRWVLPEAESASTGVPVGPLRFASALHVDADGRLDCTVDWLGAWRPYPVERCGLESGSDVEASLRSARREATITIAYSFVPAGAPPPATDAAYGALLYETAAHMSVAPDGHVADCRTLQRRVVSSRQGIAAQDICTLLAQRGWDFAPDPAGTEVRSLRIYVAVYWRAGPPPR
ncbi:MAG: hypothetical protein QOH03_5477, partial [Kribbellaceae bacterium]|jgi:TonB family protein|nr:hypothetical protein [Kribbellaceae bacterium]